MDVQSLWREVDEKVLRVHIEAQSLLTSGFPKRCSASLHRISRGFRIGGGYREHCKSRH